VVYKLDGWVGVVLGRGGVGLVEGDGARVGVALGGLDEEVDIVDFLPLPGRCTTSSTFFSVFSPVFML